MDGFQSSVYDSVAAFTHDLVGFVIPKISFFLNLFPAFGMSSWTGCDLQLSVAFPLSGTVLCCLKTCSTSSTKFLPQAGQVADRHNHLVVITCVGLAFLVVISPDRSGTWCRNMGALLKELGSLKVLISCWSCMGLLRIWGLISCLGENRVHYSAEGCDVLFPPKRFKFF